MKIRILYFLYFFINLSRLHAQINTNAKCDSLIIVQPLSRTTKIGLHNQNNYVDYTNIYFKKNGIDSLRTFQYRPGCKIPQQVNILDLWITDEKLKNSSEISNVILNSECKFQKELYQSIEVLKSFSNLKYLQINIINSFQIPHNIGELNSLDFLEVTSYYHKYYEYDTSCIGLNYFVNDGIFNLINLKYLTFNLMGNNIIIKPQQIRLLRNLEQFTLCTDTSINLVDDFFKYNKIKKINLFISSGSESRLKGLDKDGCLRVRNIPGYLINSNKYLEEFNTNYLKLKKNDIRIKEFTHLKSINTFLFKDLNRLPRVIDSLTELENLTIISRNKSFIDKRLFAKNKSLRKVYFIGKYLPQNVTSIPNLKELSIEKVKKGYENLSFLSDSVKQLSVLDVDLSKIINSIQNHHFDKIVIPITDLLKSTIEQLNCIDADTLEISNLRTTEFYKLDKEHYDYNYYKNFREGEWYKTFYVHYNRYISREYIKILQASNHFKAITYTN